MTAPVTIGAASIATDTAGYTGAPAPAPERLPTASPLIDPATSLHDLFAGGVHPEGPLWDPAGQLLELATNSPRGPHGGRSPLANGTQAPGPAGGTAVAAQVTQATTAGLTTARTWLGRQVAALRIRNG